MTNTGLEQRDIVSSSLFLLCWMAVGTAGYCFLEGWSVLDGLYMAFITLTTIGFTEVHSLSQAGRVFTIVFAAVGIGSVAFVAARWASLLVAGAHIRERQRQRRIGQMTDHYIVCGYGRVGHEVTRVLLESGKHVLVVESDSERVQECIQSDIPAILGDGTDDDVLRKAGVKQASGLFALLPDDAHNVFATLIAREHNPDLFILSRASDAVNQRRILQAGADKAVAPIQLGAGRMAQAILQPHVDRFLSHILEEDDLGLTMEQIEVEPDSFLDGKTLRSAQFRQRFEPIVVAIAGRMANEIQFNPDPDEYIVAGDQLVVLGRTDEIVRLAMEGCTANGELPVD